MTTTTDAPRPTDDATPMPCPFCGEVPNIGRVADHGLFFIECLGTCGANPCVEAGTSKSVLELWNTRAPDATLAAIVDQLPKTADGAPIHPGMTVYKTSGISMEVRGFRPINDDETAIMVYSREGGYLKALLCELYSTEVAALAESTASANDAGTPDNRGGK